ncbi:hypothetical protein [Sporomusa paucivorans]|uniref:hypothetical protein n=1 Tax=Sporomusa paucivorans TaxID=2376 RepID=UPI003571551B
MSECKHEFKMYPVPDLKVALFGLPITVSLCRHCGIQEDVVKLSLEIAGHIRYNKTLFDANVNVIKGRDEAREKNEEFMVTIADLRAKLEAAEKAKNELIDDLILERRKSSGHSSESMYFMQQAEKAEQDRDNLQAQVGVVRGALEEIEKCEAPFKRDRLEFAESVIRKHTLLASDALKLTPPEAGERVRGLVEALTAISEESPDIGARECASNALERYKGVNKNV